MSNKTNNLFVIAGLEEEKTPYEWDDMPEFVQEDNEAYQIINVRFRNAEDVREFANLIGQPNITEKTKSIWHPALDKNSTTLDVWFGTDNKE